MRPLPTPDEMAAADQATIAAGTPGVVLMDRAGRALARVAVRVAGGHYGRTAVVLCGKGNNGGDGFVAARNLHRAGLAVRCHAAAPVAELRGDVRYHADRVVAAGVPVRPLDEVSTSTAAVVIDALFGTGFRGSLTEPLAGVVESVNSSPAPVVAADIPSGVDGLTGRVEGVAVKAAVTVALAAQKLGTALPPGSALCGEVRVAPIGIEVGDVAAALLEREDVARLLPARDETAHKRSHGSVVVLGGSAGMSGAPILTSLGAYRAGAGYVTLAASRSTQAAAAGQMPELLTQSLGEGDLGPGALDRLRPTVERATALAVGPGLGRGPEQTELVAAAVTGIDIPMVIDADGLNALSQDTSVVPSGKSLVITPHPAELGRLLGVTTEDVVADRVAAARRAADDLDCVVVAKGNRTVIAKPGGRVAVNPTGGPSLATAGTGDVLTGIVAALLAAGLEPFDAACAAVWVHGLAGDMLPVAGTTAGDVAAMLPRAITASRG